jgi:hypothetical protein
MGHPSIIYKLDELWVKVPALDEIDNLELCIDTKLSTMWHER